MMLGALGTGILPKPVFGLFERLSTFSAVVFNAVLGVYQENKAEKAIEALQEMSAATSKVLRDGKIATVKSEELVVG